MKRKSSRKEQPSRHSPNLNTILMVENVLKSSSEPISVAKLKRKLPKKVMHNTLLQILDYLQLSKKIFITTQGLVWIFEESEFDKMKRRKVS